MDCSTATCPTGSTCEDLGSAKLCLETCAANADCRESEGFSGSVTNACWKF